MNMIVNQQNFGSVVLPVANDLGSTATSGTIKTHTWSGVNWVEPAAADRVIMVAIYMRRFSSTSSITSCTIDGVAATILQSLAITSNMRVALAYAVVPSGSSGNIVVTYANTLGTGWSALKAWSFAGMVTTHQDWNRLSGSDPATFGITNTKIGLLFAASYSDSTPSDPMTSPAAPHDYVSAHTVPSVAGTHQAIGDCNGVLSGTHTITVDGANTTQGVVACVFQIP